jgi:hypothetical protein
MCVCGARDGVKSTTWDERHYSATSLDMGGNHLVKGAPINSTFDWHADLNATIIDDCTLIIHRM